MSNIITLYHGSDKMIEKPEFGKGKAYNDFGKGFYCTRDIELSKEWACSNENKTSVVNTYTLDIEKIPNVKILSLYDKKYHILNHLALLVNNRKVEKPNILFNDEIFQKSKKYLLDNFLLDIGSYDIIQGHRADDRFFLFAKETLSANMPIEILAKSIALGALGEQIVIKSQRAFESLVFNREKSFTLSKVEKVKYNNKKNNRDDGARQKLLAFNIPKKIRRTMIDMEDIIDEEWNTKHTHYEFIIKHQYLDKLTEKEKKQFLNHCNI